MNIQPAGLSALDYNHDVSSLAEYIAVSDIDNVQSPIHLLYLFQMS
jgi:hypothetical protein